MEFEADEREVVPDRYVEAETDDEEEEEDEYEAEDYSMVRF